MLVPNLSRGTFCFEPIELKRATSSAPRPAHRKLAEFFSVGRFVGGRPAKRRLHAVNTRLAGRGSECRSQGRKPQTLPLRFAGYGAGVSNGEKHSQEGSMSPAQQQAIRAIPRALTLGKWRNSPPNANGNGASRTSTPSSGHSRSNARKWTDVKFTPHPATWLHQGRWLDGEPTQPQLLYQMIPSTG